MPQHIGREPERACRLRAGGRGAIDVVSVVARRGRAAKAVLPMADATADAADPCAAAWGARRCARRLDRHPQISIVDGANTSSTAMRRSVSPCSCTYWAMVSITLREAFMP